MTPAEGLTEQRASVSKPTWLQPGSESHRRLVENPHYMKACEEKGGGGERMTREGKRERERNEITQDGSHSLFVT